MSEGFTFIYEHPFIAELDAIEPDFGRQIYLTMRIENECAKNILQGGDGYGFARIAWTRDLLAWYHTSGGTAVYLLSIRYDLMALPSAA